LILLSQAKAKKNHQQGIAVDRFTQALDASSTNKRET